MAELDRSALLARPGTLLITRARPGRANDLEPEIFIAVRDDGGVLGFNGHVDLGTGIRTALAQIVAEELDVAFERVTMVLGDTERTPDQGPTIASETIQITSRPLRHAAAQAREMLVRAAAVRLGVAPEALAVTDGVVHRRDGSEGSVSYGVLLAGERLHAELAADVALKPPSEHRVIGTPVPRTDIAAKALGTFTYVHDVRLPGMLHGRVVRPPYLGHDSGPFVGRSLVAVDESSVAGLPGLAAVVTTGDFVGVVAAREEQAEQAMRALRVTWKPFTPGADLRHVGQALRTQPATRRMLREQGDVAAALAASAKRLRRGYTWPYQMHASIGPSCAVADHAPGRLVVWSGTQNPHKLRADLARLMGMQEHEVEVIRHEAAGCYGRNCADDVSGDAALLSRAVGRAVRVQLTRAQEHAWEPKGAAQLCDVEGGLDADGQVTAYDFVTRYPSNLAPMLPLLLTGIESPEAMMAPMGDRTAIPPYAYPALRIAVDDLAPILRASWLRGVSALPNTFAHECFIDELAAEAGVDPVEYRLRYLHDPRVIELVRAVTDRAGWRRRTGPDPAQTGDILRGQGFAYALYVHSTFPGFGAAWAAWVAEVEVNRRTGAVAVTKVTVGHDAGLMINPDGVRHQIHGNVIQSTSRVLTERVTFAEDSTVASREWGGYPIMTFPAVPEIDVLMIARPEQPPLGAGESASVPSAAAIANAIFHATGVRFRDVPFTADVVLAGLQPAPKPPRRRRLFGALAGFGVALATAGAGLLGLHPAIPAAASPGLEMFSPAQIERGRLLAAAGNCGTCHTIPGGVVNAGGRGIRTPFGTIYAPNITPDRATGIGAWSYAAFLRAMRQGIGRDGRNLYPAFPYTAFAGMNDADLLALYAYLMTQAPVAASSPETKLVFPFSVRPLMAGWNLLFHRGEELAPDPQHGPAWNRGRYLVEAVAHCGACHTPRNLLGAERTGARFAGAMVDGWQAPPLGAAAWSPVPWTEAAYAAYLRRGYAPDHGVAAGSMAPVVRSLAALPDADIDAMASYLASLAPSPARSVAAWPDLTADASEGARLFAGACSACHHAGDGPPVLGVNVSLAHATSLHADRPDNLIHVILAGIADPAHVDLGHMPGFADSLNDRQLAALLHFLRARFAPDRPLWDALSPAIAVLRAP